MASPNLGLLAALLKTGRLTGVVRWKVNMTQESLKVEAQIANYSCVYLDTSAATDLDQTISSLGKQLEEPDLSQENLADRLVHFGAKLKTANPTSILMAWSGWQELVKNDLAGAKFIVEIFEQTAAQWPGAILVIDSKGDFPDLAVLTSA